MNTINIVHTSDLHLDCRFSDFSSEKSKIRRVKVNSRYATGVTSLNNGDTIARCVRDIEIAK